jgi:DNA-binding PucR family transcriptional regulator
MKNRAWIRLYTEIPNDPKVQKLPGPLFKFWINCLCLAGTHNGFLPDAEELAWTLRMELKTVRDFLSELQSKPIGLLEVSEKRLTPHGWNERQYESDVSTPRVKRFRDRFTKQSETFQDGFIDRSTAVAGNGFPLVCSESALICSEKGSGEKQKQQFGCWPETARALHETDPCVDAMFVEKIARAAGSACASVDLPQITFDDLVLAAAVRASRKSKQNGAGLFLRTVPACIMTWAREGRPEEDNEVHY